jgi:hypothetical protein
MSLSVFARPTGKVTIHALAHAVQNWTGTQVERIDTVETPAGAFYCFVHFSQQLSYAADDILKIQQVTIPAVGGFVTIGLNNSGGYNPNSPDTISHIIYMDNGIFCVNRGDWSTYIWSEMEAMWVQSDIALVSAFVPDMPRESISETIVKIFNVLMPSTPAPTPVTLPFGPEKIKKYKRYTKTAEERDLVCQLFA